mgnify:CR=1 FL=1
METLIHFPYCHFQVRSYRTYEEWKLLNVEFAYGWQMDGSYRTYEEWKLILIPTFFKNKV